MPTFQPAWLPSTPHENVLPTKCKNIPTKALLEQPAHGSMSIRLVRCGKITCTWALFIVSTNILAIWAIPQIKHAPKMTFKCNTRNNHPPS